MLYSDPLFGITLTLVVFLLATASNRRTGLAIFNPLLLSIGCIIGVLVIFDIPLNDYQVGGSWISFLIKPATVALAIPLYKHFDVLIKNLKPVMMGIFIGVLTSLASVLMMCVLFDQSPELTASLLSKSITTPIGMEVTKQLGGIVPVAIAAIIFTGIFGAQIGPGLFKVLKIQDKTAQGIAMGTAAHVIGTSKAITMDEEVGAMSAIAIPIAGIMTVILAPIIFTFI